MNGGQVCGSKISVNVCPRDVIKWLNILNGLNGLGPELAINCLNGLNYIRPELAQEQLEDCRI